MEAGDLRHRVSLSYPDQVQDATTGAVSPSWVMIAEGVPAKIEPLSVARFLGAQQLQSEVSVVVTIRWRPNLRHDMRIVHGETVYDVVGFLPDRVSNRDYVTLPCKYGVNEID